MKTADSVVPMTPRVTARVAGALYLVVFVAGTVALLTRSNAANLTAGICYIAVTTLFYFIFKPVSKALSLIAALVSLAGIIFGVLVTIGLAPVRINPLVFFGIYCLLIGFLIIKSNYLPRILGVLMAIGGLSWLTFASPQLAEILTPYSFVPGMIGEGALTLWLLIMGVDEQRWNERTEMETRI